MAKPPFRERPEFLKGRSGELIVARWFQERGWYVIPSYDYSGEDGNKAPSGDSARSYESWAAEQKEHHQHTHERCMRPWSQHVCP